MISVERSFFEKFPQLAEGRARSFAQLPTLVCLCDPEGVRLLDFGLDPSFGGFMDGLVRLDIRHLRAAKRARYLGARTARA